MGWYESQQLLNEDRLPNSNLDLLLRKKFILQRMIRYSHLIFVTENIDIYQHDTICQNSNMY